MMRQVWFAACKKLGATNDEKITQAFYAVLHCYDEHAGRRYHVMFQADGAVGHVAQMMSDAGTFHELIHENVDRAILHLAIILHDVVYDPRFRDNEKRSADYAYDMLKTLGIKHGAIVQVECLINMTAYFGCTGTLDLFHTDAAYPEAFLAIRALDFLPLTTYNYGGTLRNGFRVIQEATEIKIPNWAEIHMNRIAFLNTLLANASIIFAGPWRKLNDMRCVEMELDLLLRTPPGKDLLEVYEEALELA